MRPTRNHRVRPTFCETEFSGKRRISDHAEISLWSRLEGGRIPVRKSAFGLPVRFIFSDGKA
jgi:hypothetical protein